MSRKLSRFEIESKSDVAYENDERRRWSAAEKAAKKQKNRESRYGDAPLPIIRYTDIGSPVSVWTHGLDTRAWNQAQEFASLPFIHPKGLALMPDVHVGRGVCVGSVLPTMGAIVPSAAGVDLGCGMLAVQLNLKASQLPNNLKSLRRLIESRIPTGSGVHKVLDEDMVPMWKEMDATFKPAVQNHLHLYRDSGWKHLGTLGSGNHFLEISLDENQGVWIVIHSGSRGLGSVIGQFFIDKATRRAQAEGQALPHLGWFLDTDPLFEDYVRAIEWAQNFALKNREMMLKRTMDCLELSLGYRPSILNEAINCHHNYVARENHFKTDVWVTRKGAIRAGHNEWGIIPGSMGAETYIVQGKGSEASYCSCAHGAGRAMSRAQAKQQFTTKDLKAQMAGVECQISKSRVDEIPSSYKPIKEVMKNQQDLVKVIYTLKQVLCVKGD